MAYTPAPPLGQAVMAASQPVVIASDESAVGVTQTDNVASGNITTQNLVPAGTATAGSSVEISCVGKSTVTIQVEGTWGGSQLNVQARIGGSSAWVTLSSSSTLTLNGSLSAGFIPAGQAGYLYQVNCVGYLAVRISAITGAMTGTAAISLRATASVDQVILGAPIPAGSFLIGDVSIEYRASVTGGATVAKVLTAASTNATVVKASAGRLIGWSLTNTTAAVKAVHIHNLAVAPTVGTSVPLFTIILPPSAGGSKEMNLPGGIAMATGLAYSITGAIGDLDTTVTAVGDVIGALMYV
jgi:hypothetical protein